MNADKKLTEYKSVSTKKDKESKKNRFKRMITRPLRRSHSAGCEEECSSIGMYWLCCHLFRKKRTLVSHLYR
jgi:hypothetical protein